MHETIRPTFASQWQPLVDQAAIALRGLALDETAKEKFCSDPVLRSFMHRVSGRYVAGQTVAQALARVASINAAGHAASVEYMGESCRDAERANAETEVFLELVAAVGARGLNASISFDLSHVGMVVDVELGYRNARRIAQAAARMGREVMISMEGSERADDIYAIYSRLHTDNRLDHVGITLPAKLHRSAADLPRLMAHPGRIRLVKGAFLETADVAYARNSAQLGECYRRFAQTLLRSGHRCSIATHDRAIQNELCEVIANENIKPHMYEFESLMGLGAEQLSAIQARGCPTREYAVFGEEHFLYVLNRMAEEPIRVYQALVDLLAPAPQ